MVQTLTKADAPSVLAELKRRSNPRIREEMSSRHGMVTRDACGGHLHQPGAALDRRGCAQGAVGGARGG